MATAKKAAPAAPAKSAKAGTNAVALKKTSGAVVDIRAQLAAQAAAMNERTAPASGISIRTAGKKFAFPDGRKDDGPVEMVVIDFVARNEFYEADFDKDNIVPPACFAIGTIPTKLIPSGNSPQQQCDDCASCPMNAFGSKGKGKACSNTRLLAVVEPGSDADAPIYLLKVSPTGLKSFDGFVQSTSRTFQVPPVGVVVTVGFDDGEDYPKLTFTDAKPNEDLEVHFGRQEEARALLNQEPDVSGYETPKPKGAKGRAAPARR
jgi:hypothetical protein